MEFEKFWRMSINRLWRGCGEFENDCSNDSWRELTERTNTKGGKKRGRKKHQRNDAKHRFQLPNPHCPPKPTAFMHNIAMILKKKK